MFKELKVKYKRSVLGFFWSLITPVALTGIYLFVFIYVYRVPKSDFSLFLLTGLLPWHYFNLGLISATNSIIDNAPLVRKVFFPRILLPVSTVFANLLNFLFGLALLFIWLMASGRPIWLTLHWLLLAIVMETALCIGISLALSVWNVFLRDIRQIINLFIMVLFFATPIVYEFSEVPSRFRWVILANPLAAVMELYRAALFTVEAPDPFVTLVGLAEIALVAVFGYAVFRRTAPGIAREV